MFRKRTPNCNPQVGPSASRWSERRSSSPRSIRVLLRPSTASTKVCMAGIVRMTSRITRIARTLVAVLLTCTAVTAASAQTQPNTSVPIIFVHGNGDDASKWIGIIWLFESNNYPPDKLFSIRFTHPAPMTPSKRPTALPPPTPPQSSAPSSPASSSKPTAPRSPSSAAAAAA